MNERNRMGTVIGSHPHAGAEDLSYYGHSRRSGAARIGVCTLALLIVIGVSAPVQAHKITLFAAVRGALIEGQVSLQGGAAAPDTRLTIYDGTGREVVKLVTDQEGKFSYEPRYRSDYRVVANAGLGHKAETTIPASQLPADLPLVIPQPGVESAKTEQPPSSKKAESTTESIPRDEVVRELRVLSGQTAALRMELDRWREHQRFQDIVGGVGYIVGIAGLAFFLLGYRRRNR
jgi:hypothetical protein